MKRLLLLGGLRYLIPVIKAAHKMGHYVITCDYLPDNIAHKYSDEYHNVSILDKDAVLELAKSLKIDGIMSFAVDPGVETAAYVAEKLNLPSPGPYESVKILQNKALFRQFLETHNFNVPKSVSHSDIDKAIIEFNEVDLPVIVKPVDSAGSKGISKVNRKEELRPAIQYALQFSASKAFIIEEFLEKKGFSSDSDCLSVNGKFEIVTFSNQRFDETSPNPYTPSGFSWPSDICQDNQIYLKNELQRLITLLNMTTSVYNIEVRVSMNNKAYIMEVAPRGGGNRLSEMIEFATGIPLITYAIKGALGEKICDIPPLKYRRNWGEITLHSNQKGIFKGIEISREILPFIVEEDLWVNENTPIMAFTGANETIGTLVISCPSKDNVEYIIDNCHKFVTIIVE